MKKWWTSKTVWLNLLGIIAIIVQDVTGNDVLPPENQAAALGMINLVLRSITGTPIVWK